MPIVDEQIKTFSFGSENKHLKIENGYLEFDGGKIILDTVTDIKYGVEPIQVDMFYIGRRFVIDLKSKENQVKIILKSYFDYHKTYFYEVFNRILKTIWKETTIRLIDESIETILQGGELAVGKCKISKDGILYSNHLITWADLTYQKKYEMITINCKSNPKIWTNMYFLQDYNVDVLKHILDWVYEYEGLQEIEDHRLE